MSSVLLSDERVVRLRRRPKETSSEAKTSWVPFREDPVKELSIPAIADAYNCYMGAVNKFDYLTA